MTIQSIPHGFKRCSKCGEVKAITEFGKHMGEKDQLQRHCKSCRAYSSKQKRKDNPEQAKLKDRRQREKNPEKLKVRLHQWYEDNKESARAKKQVYMKINADKIREYNRLYRKKYPEKTREWNRRWHHAKKQKGTLSPRNANVEMRRESVRRRRARKNKIPYMSSIPHIESILFDVQNGYCLYCQSPLFNGYHVDHIIPIALVEILGKHHPGHVPSNLCLACPHCNISKSDSVLEAWLAWKYPDQMDEILHRVEQHIKRMEEWE